jgi:hypothetical protein
VRRAAVKVMMRSLPMILFVLARLPVFFAMLVPYRTAGS